MVNWVKSTIVVLWRRRSFCVAPVPWNFSNLNNNGRSICNTPSLTTYFFFFLNTLLLLLAHCGGKDTVGLSGVGVIKSSLNYDVYVCNGGKRKNDDSKSPRDSRRPNRFSINQICICRNAPDRGQPTFCIPSGWG